MLIILVSRKDTCQSLDHIWCCAHVRFMLNFVRKSWRTAQYMYLIAPFIRLAWYIPFQKMSGFSGTHLFNDAKMCVSSGTWSKFLFIISMTGRILKNISKFLSDEAWFLVLSLMYIKRRIISSFFQVYNANKLLNIHLWYANISLIYFWTIYSILYLQICLISNGL